MITGKKNMLQYSTKRGKGADRSNILTYVPETRKKRINEGKLSISASGLYRYEPSAAYKRALNKFYNTVPKSAITVSNFSF